MCTVSFIIVVVASLAAKYHNLSEKVLGDSVLKISIRGISAAHTQVKYENICEVTAALFK